MKRWRTEAAALRLAVALLFGAVAVAPNAHSETQAVAESHLSAEGLQRVARYFQDEAAAGKIPGAVVLIQQHGKPVLFETFGFRDPATRTPMTRDAIFRIYSMSKPITSVAAMMLVDDGKLALSDPVSKYIPSFAGVKVGVERKGDGGGLALEPLERPITIEDLLRHTSGITYGFYGDSPVRKLHMSSGLFDGDFDNAEFVARLARLPLAEQPETQWDYGHSTDVLGRVVEIVSGKSLYQFENERLLGPLGMADTGFFVPKEKRARVAEFLPGDRFDRPIAGLDDPIRQRRWESGGAGMDGTAADYARFAEMLLEGGTLDGRRYLRPETVASMSSDHIGPDTGIARDGLYFPGHSGFGYGFAVRTVATTLLPEGEYGWDGVGGTFFFIDPRDDLFAIVMMQAPSQRGRIEDEVKQLIYEALTR